MTEFVAVRDFPIDVCKASALIKLCCDYMTIKAHLAELERQHKVLEHETAEALAHSLTDYF